MGTGNHAVGWIITIEDGEYLGGTRSISPITHQLANNREVGYDLNSGITHAIIRVLADVDGSRARRLMVRPHAISGVTKRERKESRACISWSERERDSISLLQVKKALTNIGNDPSYDNLRLVGGLHRGPEFLVIPGVHLALAFHDRDIGV